MLQTLSKPIKLKAENLSHQKRRHWDMREFDEYIIATECTHIHIPTPEEILCHKETMCELMAVLATCTEVQQERFLPPALLAFLRRKTDAHYQFTQALPTLHRGCFY